MKIVVPMAGPEKAFHEAGYPFCKTLIEVKGKPLIQHVFDTLKGIRNAEFVFIVQKEDVTRYHLKDVLSLLSPTCNVVVAQGNTAGAACSVLTAIDCFEPDDELLITNGDQILRVDINAVLDDFRNRTLDAGTMVFDSVHPRWSFVRVSDSGLVTEAAEKRPISRLATAGLYYFRRADDFTSGAMDMILKDSHVNGQFYICPVFNELLLKQKRIGVSTIEQRDYISLATPQGVQQYEERLTRELS